MIKFFKEIIGSFKEGINEAKDEIAKEEQLESDNIENAQEENKRIISQINYDEKFGTALAAPFRIVIFGDWFTLFKSLAKENDHMYPIHLYTFGEYPKLEKHRHELIKFIKRDFNIDDKKSSLDTLSSYFDIAGIDKSGTILRDIVSEKVDNKMWDTNKNGINATICAVIAHIITASTDVGYIEKLEALELLKKVSKYAKSHYSNWNEYADDFLLGEQNTGLNFAMGTKILKKYVGYLRQKQGSPWNNISWEVKP